MVIVFLAWFCSFWAGPLWLVVQAVFLCQVGSKKPYYGGKNRLAERTDSAVGTTVLENDSESVGNRGQQRKGTGQQRVRLR
jgi:hypothetical protein